MKACLCIFREGRMTLRPTMQIPPPRQAYRPEHLHHVLPDEAVPPEDLLPACLPEPLNPLLVCCPTPPSFHSLPLNSTSANRISSTATISATKPHIATTARWLPSTYDAFASRSGHTSFSRIAGSSGAANSTLALALILLERSTRLPVSCGTPGRHTTDSIASASGTASPALTKSTPGNASGLIHALNVPSFAMPKPQQPTRAEQLTRAGSRCNPAVLLSSYFSGSLDRSRYPTANPASESCGSRCRTGRMTW